MKINAVKFYTFLFSVVIFSQLYISSFKLNIILQLLTLLLFFAIDKPTIPKIVIKIIFPVVLVFCSTFLVYFFYDYKTINLIKDISHFIKPITGLLIGFMFYRKINNLQLFIKTIVYLGILSALVHFVILLTLGNAFDGSISSVREYGKDNFLELIALFFLVFNKRFFNKIIFQSKTVNYFYLFILVVSITLYFSRTMIITSLLFLLTLYGYTQPTKKTIQIITTTLLSVALLYGYLFSVKIERNKPGLESFLFKIKNAPEELFKSKIDRENHKDLWDHWRGYEVNRAFELMKQKPSSFLVGAGQGSLVNLKFYAPLTSTKKGIKFISELHNGYVYVFYKSGLIGLLLILLFIYRLYKYIEQKSSSTVFTRTYISAISLFYFFTTLTITGIYNARDIMIFIVGALLFFNYDQQMHTTNK